MLGESLEKCVKTRVKMCIVNLWMGANRDTQIVTLYYNIRGTVLASGEVVGHWAARILTPASTIGAAKPPSPRQHDASHIVSRINASPVV